MASIAAEKGERRDIIEKLLSEGRVLDAISKGCTDKNIKSVQKKIEACLAEAAKTCEESKWKCVYGSEAEPGKLRSDFFQENGTLSIRFVAPFDVPCTSLAAIAREFDLVTSWNKFCSNALILSVHSLMSLSIYAESWLPWPYANRSLILKALACDVLDQHGCYCIIMEQIEELDEEKNQSPEVVSVRKIVPESASVECDVKEGSFIKLVPIAKNKTEATMVFHLDAKMAMAPDFLIQFFFYFMTPWIYNMMKNVVQNAVKESSPYNKRFKEHEEFYNLMNQRSLTFIEASESGEKLKKEDEKELNSK